MPLRHTLIAAIAATAAALVAASPSSATTTSCEPPAIGINMCVVSMSKDLEDGQANKPVWIRVEIVSASAVLDGSLLATAVTTSPAGESSSQTLIDNEPFSVEPGDRVTFKVRLDPPAGQTEVDFFASAPSIGFPYGYSTVSVSMIST
jgi:hypothetical protein